MGLDRSASRLGEARVQDRLHQSLCSFGEPVTGGNVVAQAEEAHCLFSLQVGISLKTCPVELMSDSRWKGSLAG